MTVRFITGSYAPPEAAAVCRFSFGWETGFRMEMGWNGFINPSFVLPHPRLPVLYAVEETAPEGRVLAYRGKDDSLEFMGGFSSGGADPCHLCLSADERYLYAANYTSGVISAFSLNEAGAITGRTDRVRLTGRGPDALRQEGPHAHCSLELDGLLYVCDLGADRIAVFENRAGRLVETASIPLPSGCGPRHLTRWKARPELLYCVTELESSVYVLRREENGWIIVQRLSALPEGFRGESTAAAIRFTPDGRFLMTSNRGHDSVAVFPVQADGLLGKPVISPCAAQPRDFLPLAGGVIVGSQRDGVIRAYTLNESALKLEETPFFIETPSPVCFALL